MVRVRGIEPRSRVWKTRILTAVLHPHVEAYATSRFAALAAKASIYSYASPFEIAFSRFAPWIAIS